MRRCRSFAQSFQPSTSGGSEIATECREDLAEEVSERTREAMTRAGEDLLSKVPVEVEVVVSREWRK